jgi:hypothetical protein
MVNVVYDPRGAGYYAPVTNNAACLQSDRVVKTQPWINFKTKHLFKVARYALKRGDYDD